MRGSKAKISALRASVGGKRSLPEAGPRFNTTVLNVQDAELCGCESSLSSAPDR